MKTTYLVNALQPDGTTVLVETTADHWHEITERNKQLPKTDRRYFIVDIINEAGVFDCMIMEAPYKEYLRWHAERSPATRNQTLKRLFSHLSIDAGSVNFFPDPTNLEEVVLGEEMICELRDALANWRPWGVDFLCYYIDEKKTVCTSEIAQKYGVSQRQARTYKDQFEKFVKKFYS